MLGMLEGGKDSRANIELAFKPIFEQLQELARDFNLDLDRPSESHGNFNLITFCIPDFYLSENSRIMSETNQYHTTDEKFVNLLIF